MKFKKDNDGSIVIEATLVLSTCMFLLFLMISIGMILYRQALVTATANQTASDIAMIYPYLSKEPATGFTAEYDFDSASELYRYMLGLADAHKTENKDKAEWYANALLKKGSLSDSQNGPAQVDVRIEGGNALRRDITVKITETYPLPVAGLFQLFGLPGELEITAVGAAECVDMIDFMDTVNFFNAAVDQVTPMEDTFKAITKWLTWIKDNFL